MRAALLLVDLQYDYLEHGGLAPAADALLPRVLRLLDDCRTLGVAITHIHTLVRPDGSDRMPHLKTAGVWWCVEGSAGARPPPALEPAAGEPVFVKQVFSAFANTELFPYLTGNGIDTLIIAGLHAHACVRETAIDGYERGFSVWIAADAIASHDPLHARVTQNYLSARGITYLDSDEILSRLGGLAKTAPAPGRTPNWPAAIAGGQRREARHHLLTEMRDPALWDRVRGHVPNAVDADIVFSVETARNAQATWSRIPPAERAGWLLSWADTLSLDRDSLSRSLTEEIGKPISDSRAEVDRAIEHLRLTAGRFAVASSRLACGRDVWAHRRPVGVVAIITPWNNPLSIALGKIAPALMFGNTVVWKPALPPAQTSLNAIESLAACGAPPGIVNLVMGDGYTALRLVEAPGVDAVSLTGSSATGRAAAAACAQMLRPLQAELGGNNALIVMADADVEAAARAVAHSAFSNAGQRCTAPRRLIVQAGIARRFTDALVAATEALRIGEPTQDATQLGPLVSRSRQQHVERTVQRAISEGARVLCGGTIPSNLAHGCWYAPTLLADVTADAAVVREETFGPVAVIQTAADIEEAVELCNSVPQGLVAALYSNDTHACRHFLDHVVAGVLKFNQPTAGVHPAAPFGGWKESGLGPPEHGAWDEEFYSRAQAVYGVIRDS
jgi:acyl-CoA reductase-like NAD-dependent aldehyde dehydrogenase/nicotinamidase-related amidase